MKIYNDGTFGYYLIKHISEIAKDSAMDAFIYWCAKNLIIPYSGKDEPIIKWLCIKLGFKKLVTLDKLYKRLQKLEF